MIEVHPSRETSFMGNTQSVFALVVGTICVRTHHTHTNHAQETTQENVCNKT